MDQNKDNKQTEPKDNKNGVQKLGQDSGQKRRQCNSRIKSENVYSPLHVSRKSKRLMADSEKDEKYWDRRKKNNLATKRSRDRRREQEIEVASRWKELEQENTMLKELLLKLRARAADVENKLSRFESVFQ